MAQASTDPTRSGYLADTRGWTYSTAVVVPVLVAYELGVRLLDRGLGIPVRNGADVILQELADLAGPLGRVGLPVLVVLVLGFLVWREQRRRRVALRRGFLMGMLLETAIYAFLFGALVGRATAFLVPHAVRMDAAHNISSIPLVGQLALSLGAGIYEEILFRGMILGALRALLRQASRLAPWLREALAVGAAAAAFSAFHYVGAWGDSFSATSFIFRLIFGVVFSVLLVTRGFGVTVLTHALYDVVVTLGL